MDAAETRAPLDEKLRRAFRLGRAVRLAWRAAPRLVAAHAALLVVSALLPLAGLYCAKEIIDAVAGGVAAGGGAEALRRATLWLLAAAGVAVVSAVVGGASAMVAEALGQEVTDDVNDLLHRKSVAIDLGYYEDPDFHDTLHRAQQEAPYRPTRVVDGLARLLQNGVALLAMAGLLATVSPWMGLALGIAALPGVAVRFRFSNQLFGWQHRASVAERKAWYFHSLLTFPAWAAEVRSFELGPFLRRRFAAVRAVLRGERLALGRRRAGADTVAAAIAAVVALAVFYPLAAETIAGVLTIGAFVMYFQAFQRGLAALQGLLTSLADLYEDHLFLEHLDAFLDLEEQVREPEQPRPFPHPLLAGLRLEGVRFGYRGAAAAAVDGVSFAIAPGEVVALVGPNGSGKTTLVKLLLRLYDPAAGRITVDGTDLRDFSTGELRRQVAVLLQDFGRYAMSARDNVWLGDVAAAPTDPRLEEAARRTGADGVVDSLPRGWETVLGTWFDDGRELSAGQWQKLALARAVFRDAQLVVLDEPSSALDPFAERELFASFRQLVAGRSALFISHRFSTVRMADRIVVLDAGRVVESGSHDELVAAGGMYARMWSAQAGPYQRAPTAG